MANSIFDSGPKEIAGIKKRVLRDAALGRIDKSDTDQLVALCDQMDALIVRIQMESDLTGDM